MPYNIEERRRIAKKELDEGHLVHEQLEKMMQYMEKSMFIPIHVSELRVGDVIQPRFNSPYPYSVCTVFKIDENQVYLRRPFCYSLGCTEEVKLTASAEEYSVYRNISSTENQWILLEREKDANK